MKKSATMKDLLLALTENMSAEEILPADIISSLSNAIAKKRIGLDMTQAELAASIGKKQSTISKWENGDMNFTVRLLAEIAVKLGMDLQVELKDHSQVQHAGGVYTVVKDNTPSFHQGYTYSSMKREQKGVEGRDCNVSVY